MVSLKAPKKATASATALAVLVAAPLGLAIAHPGFPTADVDLYARAVWVTNQATGLLGQVNLQVRELTASVPVAQALDVLQVGDTVVAHNQEADSAGRVDAAVQRVPALAALSPGADLSLGDGVISVLDPVAGALWSLPVETALEGELDPALAVDLGRDALAVTSTQGTVFATSTETSSVVRIATPGSQPERVADLPEGDLMLTTVGERLVIASTTGSGTRISVVGGGSTDLPPGPIRLQLPGAEADAVVVATADTLLAVPLGGGDPRSLDGPAPAPAAAPSEIAAPAVVDDCVYGAWAASAHYVRACDDGEVQTEALVGVRSSDELVFRINRSSVVLNSVASGVVWLVQDDMTVIEAEDWLAVAPPEEDDEAPESDESTTQPSFDEILAERPETNTPPEPKNDDFGMRAGRATVLPVLENDIDLDGDVLTIASVTGLSPDVAQLDIIDGGRALQITPVSDAAVSRTFGYTVTDGRPGGTAQAVVTVTIAPEEQNRAPEAQRVSQLSLEAGGTISYNVLADWRDPDGDDLYLTAAASTAGDSVRFSPDGLVTLTHSGTEPGERTIVFTVSDGGVGVGEQPQGELRVSIEPGGSLPPLTVPDFGFAFADQDVVINPLSNDVPRSSRQLSLLSVEPLTEGARWTAVPDTNDYRFGASEPGTHYFVYAASTGAGQESQGILRLDVVPDPEEPLPPIAVKDSAFLRPNEPLTVPVLLNDVSPSGAVLGVQSIDVPQTAADQGLTVEVLGGAYLRVSATNVLPFPINVGYTISDGEQSSTSTVTVVPIPELSTHQSPIARDDRITVRAGDTASLDVLSNDLHPDGALMTLNPDLVQGFEGNDGVGFVMGNAVRLQAPSETGTYTLVYRVDDAFSEYATARVVVTVTAADAATNAAPLPPTVTSRVQAGGELTVDIPTSGVDGDGDSVILLSATGATMGQVTAVSQTGFQYRAGTDAGGTETIRYTVQDAYGARGQGDVRIGVIPPPEVPLPPVAVDDTAEVRPGATVAVRVLANDSDPANAAFSLDPELIEVQEGITAEVVDEQYVAVTAGELEGSFVLRYGITNVQGGVDDAFVQVAVTPDARPQAPLAQDHVLTVTDILGLDQVEVNLLEDAFNPDGEVSALEIGVEGPGAAAVSAVEGGVAVVALSERRQSIAYTVTSPETGLSATAFVVVPAATSALPPYLKPEVQDEPPALAIGSTTTLQIRDLVEVPSGGVLVIRDEGVISATSGLADVTEVTETELRVTPTEDQRGDAQSITVLVTDGITDVEAGSPIEIPVIVGDPESRDVAPTFTPFEVLIEADGATTERDLRAAVAHPNDSIVESMTFAAEISGETGAVRVSVAGGVLTASAPLGGAQPGDQVTIDLTLQSEELLTESVTARVVVRVVPSTRPLAQAVDDVEPDGRSSSSYVLSPLDNDFNPFAAIDGELTIVDATFEGDPLGATVDNTATTVTVSTGAAKSGTVTVVYTVRDASNEESRQVQGRITVIVTSAPEPPTFAGAPQRAGSRTLTVQFNPPSSWNGSPEEAPAYTVHAYLAGTNNIVLTREDCGPGTTCEFSTLTNDTAHEFVVIAKNGVGETASSRSAAETPYGTPSRPGTPSLSGDFFAPATLTASWGGVSDTGGGAARYQWKYSSAGDPAPAYNGLIGTSSQTIASGVGEGTYRIVVRACNRANICGPWSTESNQVTVLPRASIDVTPGTFRYSGGNPPCTNAAPCRDLDFAYRNMPPGSWQVTVRIGGTVVLSERRNLAANGTIETPNFLGNDQFTVGLEFSDGPAGAPFSGLSGGGRFVW